MPIWFELMVLLLITYTTGLGIGWVIWGREAIPAPTKNEGNTAT